jgi:hypothetical protein
MTTEIETRTPIDAHVLALDETDHYFIDPPDAPFIARIRGGYLFDRNQRTHGCEWTPSYYLIHLYDQVLLTDAGNALDDDARDALYQKYEYEGGDNCYVHCHTVERLIEKAGRFEHHHYGDPEMDLDDVEYDDQIEALREHLCCNCVI